MKVQIDETWPTRSVVDAASNELGQKIDLPYDAACCCSMQHIAAQCKKMLRTPLILLSYVSCLNLKNCCYQTNISGEKRTNQDLIHANQPQIRIMLIPEKAYSLREAVLFFFTFKRYEAMRKGPFPNIFIYKLQWLLRYEVSLKMELSYNAA